MGRALPLDTQHWLGDFTVRQCTHHERGVLVEVMCLLHGSPTYGVLHWPLAKIAAAAGSDEATLRALVDKGVLLGQDAHVKSAELPFLGFRGRRGCGESEVLVDAQDGDVWFVPSMVAAEHRRTLAGGGGGSRHAALPCPHERLIQGFMVRFPSAPRPVSHRSDSRLGRAMAAQWRRHATAESSAYHGYASVEEGVQKWDALFALAAQSPFLRGEVPGRNGRPSFQITIDWLMDRAHLERLANGFYPGRVERFASIQSVVRDSVERVGALVSEHGRS